MRLRPMIVAAVGVLAVSTVAATPVVSAQQRAVDTLEPMPPEDVQRVLVLNDHRDEWRQRVDALSRKLPGAHVSDVVGDANRPAARKCAGLPGAPDGPGFCWDDGDGKTTEWIPQGLTASWDADWDGNDGGRYDGHKVLLTSWYDPNKDSKANRGVRVTFVNYDDPEQPRYRHAILVVPTENGDVAPVIDHAGGIAWVGKKLYVADTWGGLRVFDLSTIWRGEADDTHAKFKVDGNKVYAADYRYVVPQVGYYSTPGNEAPGHCDPNVLRTSFASVDSKTRTLATGEFCEQATGGRIARWKVDDNGDLVSAGGKVTAADGYRVPHARMQGGVTYGEQFATTSSEEGADGQWHRMVPRGRPENHGIGHPGPEDMSYDHWNDKVWTLTEHDGRRFVFAIPGAGLK